MSATQSKQSHAHQHAPAFNYEAHVRELNKKFRSLVRQLGDKNEKGTLRYDFEVDFAYALHDLKTCPVYMQGKRFDHASSIVGELFETLKTEESAA